MFDIRRHTKYLFIIYINKLENTLKNGIKIHHIKIFSKY